MTRSIAHVTRSRTHGKERGTGWGDRGSPPSQPPVASPSASINSTPHAALTQKRHPASRPTAQTDLPKPNPLAPIPASPSPTGCEIKNN
jgi:hypothetical protein